MSCELYFRESCFSLLLIFSTYNKKGKKWQKNQKFIKRKMNLA